MFRRWVVYPVFYFMAVMCIDSMMHSLRFSTQYYFMAFNAALWFALPAIYEDLVQHWPETKKKWQIIFIKMRYNVGDHVKYTTSNGAFKHTGTILDKREKSVKVEDDLYDGKIFWVRYTDLAGKLQISKEVIRALHYLATIDSDIEEAGTWGKTPSYTSHIEGN